MSETESKLNLEELQREELKILIGFREICRKYGLSYFITAGTLLGAIRHKGFIPWDDDVDVVMPRKDYDKLAKLMRKAPRSEFFYQDSKTDKLYPFGFAKLRSNGCLVYESVLENVQINNGCYIDIFPLDRCPNGDGTARLFFKLYLFFTTALIKKVNPRYEVGYGKKAVLAAQKAASRLPRGVINALRETVRRCTFGKRLCTVGGAHGYPRETYLREWFESEVSVEFEGEKFSAPSGWDNLLTNMYGDYMTPPAENERGGHFAEIKKEN